MSSEVNQIDKKSTKKSAQSKNSKHIFFLFFVWTSFLFFVFTFRIAQINHFEAIRELHTIFYFIFVPRNETNRTRVVDLTSTRFCHRIFLFFGDKHQVVKKENITLFNFFPFDQINVPFEYEFLVFVESLN